MFHRFHSGSRFANKTANKIHLARKWQTRYADVKADLKSATYKGKLTDFALSFLVVVDHTPVYPREVVRRALELSATALILIHNHPSGDPTPSRADIEMTKTIVDTAKALGITVHDHIIIGKDGHASFKGLRLL